MAQPALALLKTAVDEAVSAEGLRAFAERTGVPLGVVRGAQRDQNLTAASIAKLAAALGFEFYVGPRHREAPDPAALPPGLAEAPALLRMSSPGRDAWSALDRPAPEGAFFLRCEGDAEAAEFDRFCLVEPEVRPAPGTTVYLEDREGRVAIGRYEGADPASGWIRVRRHGAAMVDERAPGSLRRLAAVTWTGRTPPPAPLSDVAGAGEQALARQRRMRREIDAILAELRERLVRAIE